MSETLTLENKSETDYILEYLNGDKKNFMFLLGGDKRIIANKSGEAGLRISTSSHGLKDFSFFGNFPGKLIIQKSENEDYDFIYDLNSSKKINLKFSKNNLRLIRKELVKQAFNVVSFNKLDGDQQKKTIEKSGIDLILIINHLIINK